MAKIFIMGAGGFGTALGVMSNKLGHNVTLWSPFEKEVDLLIKTREQPLLPYIKIPGKIEITTSLEDIQAQELVIIATPSEVVRTTAKLLAENIPPDTTVVCVSKGIEVDSYKTLSAVLEEELPTNRKVMLSGPSHAEELSRGEPTTVVAASRNREASEYVQDILSNESLRIYANDDVIGVELGGALKNVIALASGILDGLGAGDNTKAALMTRGLAEIARLGVVLGARTETFAGLSGIGDLIVTCGSMHSRNRRCGILLGQGKPLNVALDEIKMVVEGVNAVRSAKALARKYGVEMPIVNAIYDVLFNNKLATDALNELMRRDLKHED